MRDFALELQEIGRYVKHPLEVQEILFSLEYTNTDTMKSAKEVWKSGTAHCLEAVHLAAAIMENLNYPPLALSLDSADNICHVVYAFRGPRGWGCLGRSKEAGLHGRAPVFRSLRDLAWSYFDPYVDETGLLKGYALVNLDDSGADWRFSQNNVWASEKHILKAKHKLLRASEQRYKFALRTHRTGGHKRQPYWW